MAKDPAFLFYPADAAEDVSHMNRLERGCYFDLIQAQKKFGKLSIELVKKILGKDFETCWENIKICLSYENDVYFIEWLQNSIEKRVAYSESRKTNRIGKKEPHMNNISERYDKHMVNGIVNGNTNTKGGSGGNKKPLQGIEFDEEKKGVFFLDKSYQELGELQKEAVELGRLIPNAIIKGEKY